MRFALLMLLLAGVALPAAAQMPTFQQLVIVGVPQASTTSLLPGQSATLTVTAARVCPSTLQVLPASTLVVVTATEGGVSANGPSEVALAQQVCAQQPKQEVSFKVNVTAHPAAVAGQHQVTVTMHADASEPLTASSDPAVVSMLFTVREESKKALPLEKAAPGAGPLALLALLGCVAARRRSFG